MGVGAYFSDGATIILARAVGRVGDVLTNPFRCTRVVIGKGSVPQCWQAYGDRWWGGYLNGPLF